ncbi:MAG: phosphatase PAP2 family protein, partial [Gemmatimonadota bacterium]|nr:phosphatase PAP2 family protein [Gemmatimonadota bacterium]
HQPVSGRTDRAGLLHPRQGWLHAPAKQLLYSQWISGLIRQVSGLAVGRRRPSQEESAYVFDPGNGKSFPSGHSAMAMAIATVLAHHVGHSAATVALYAAAGTIVFQRVDAGEH